MWGRLVVVDSCGGVVQGGHTMSDAVSEACVTRKVLFCALCKFRFVSLLYNFPDIVLKLRLYDMLKIIFQKED